MVLHLHAGLTCAFTFSEMSLPIAFTILESTSNLLWKEHVIEMLCGILVNT